MNNIAQFVVIYYCISTLIVCEDVPQFYLNSMLCS
uniref:Uncharacterized protein n=1 Tax=Arundo donax TaxID=35708 RepID=A0A0A9C7A8_ARUDO